MERIRVLQDVEGEYAGERVALRAGRYRTNPIRAGHAAPGRDIREKPVASYVLEDEGTRRPVHGITIEAMEELQRRGLVRVEE